MSQPSFLIAKNRLVHEHLATPQGGRVGPAKRYATTINRIERELRERADAPVASVVPLRHYTVPQVAEFLGLSTSFVRREIHAGRLPASILAGGRVIRVAEVDLVAYLSGAQKGGR